MNTTEDIHAVQRERGKVYGEPHHSHTNIGLAWTAIIQQHYGITLDHPLPHWLVEQMMASFKIQRSARVFHKDNYTDAFSYLAFAEHGQKNPKDPYTEHETQNQNGFDGLVDSVLKRGKQNNGHTIEVPQTSL